jgi:hypothetical protein
MDLLYTLEDAHGQAQRRIKTRFAQSKLARLGFKKPGFGTEMYREWQRKGWISPEEAEADELMRAIRAARTGQQKPHRDLMRSWSTASAPIRATSLRHMPVRWGREVPIPSDQYARNMATTAARDDRLTPQSKALLQVLHARCGEEGQTVTTKGTLGNIMSRCERSIQRYLAELVRFGYIVTHTKRSKAGLYVGLVIGVTGLVKPFYEDLRRTAEIIAPLLAGDLAIFAGASSEIPDETQVSPKKRFIYKHQKDALTRGAT